jgi:hypothetical protein
MKLNKNYNTLSLFADTIGWLIRNKMIKKIFTILVLLAVTTNGQTKKTGCFFSETDGFVKVGWDTFLFLANMMEVPIKKNSPQDNFDFMFIKTPVDTLFKLPYIMVQINERGRFSRSDIEDLVKNQFRLDYNTNYLWQEGNDHIQVIIPTQFGSINVFCRSSEADSANDKVSFKKFINSIVLYKGTKYSTNFLRDIPVLNKILFEGSPLGAILFFTVVIYFASRQYRRLRD